MYYISKGKTPAGYLEIIQFLLLMENPLSLVS